jgi:hypothetical protein
MADDILGVGRRGFLSLLGGAGIGLLLPTRFVNDPASLLRQDVMYPATLRGLTTAVMAETERQLGDYKMQALPPGIRDIEIGASVSGYGEIVMFTDRKHVETVLLPEHEYVSTRYVEPVAELIAGTIRHRRLTHFAELPLNGRCDQLVVASDRFTLRGSAQYDIAHDSVHVRYDFLGGYA